MTNMPSTLFSQDWMSHKISLDKIGNIKEVQGVAYFDGQRSRSQRRFY